MVIYFLILLLTHLYVDWQGQGRFVAENKGRFSLIMNTHCLQWAAFISLWLAIFGQFALWKFIFLFVGHYAVDKWKCIQVSKYDYTDPANDKKTNWLLSVDQFIHIIQLIIVM